MHHSNRTVCNVGTARGCHDMITPATLLHLRQSVNLLKSYKEPRLEQCNFGVAASDMVLMETSCHHAVNASAGSMHHLCRIAPTMSVL